jgi:hypothetical protein
MQQDPLAPNIDLDMVCRTLGLPRMEGAALAAWQERYLSQATKMAAVRMPPQGGNAGPMPYAAGNGGGLAPGLNGQQLQQGLQAGEVVMKYTADRPVIKMAAEDVWNGLPVEMVDELPLALPEGMRACIHDDKVYALNGTPGKEVRRFAALAEAALERMKEPEDV